MTQITIFQHYQVIVSTLINNKNQVMAQSNSQWNEQQLQTTDADHQALSFPKIHKRSSANEGNSLKKIQKNMTSLPSLKNNQSLKQHLRQLHIQKQAANGQENLLTQIQQKVKHVLEKMNSGDKMQQQPIKNNQIQFQDQIKLNKQKIKHIINTNEKKQAPILSRQIEKQQSKNIINAHKRNNSSYDKQQNFKREIFVQKRKKQNVQNAINHKQRQKNELPPKPFKKQKAQIMNQALHQANQHKSPQNIFDSIHNMLQNPRGRVFSVQSKINPKQIQKLQKKIKQINEKLGTNDQSETKQTFNSSQFINNTVHDWKRISYSNEFKFKCKRDSNFEKQLEKIINLQERNRAKIGDFITNQLELITLRSIKKTQSRAEKGKPDVIQ